LTAAGRFATTPAMSLPVLPLDRLDFAYAPWAWPFASTRRAEIDAYFARRSAGSAHIWNGSVLLMRDCRIVGASLTGTCFETDFASFLAWRDWEFPDRGVTNCFAMGALLSADGAFLLGVMGPHTANAGRVYFPAGTPDPNDIVDGRLDLAGSVAREVAEETGLTPADYVPAARWHVVPTGVRLALMRVLAAPLSAAELQRRMRAHLAREATPELADIRIVRGEADFDPMMPPFVTAYLAHWFGGTIGCDRGGAQGTER
jgi:8-oxo-dGTP pyrophosphatase MutT (NUDIX family)